MEFIIDVFISTLGLYFLAGLLFGIFFSIKGAALLDEGVKDTPWHFKLIILPGSIILWPYLLIKILKK